MKRRYALAVHRDGSVGVADRHAGLVARFDNVAEAASVVASCNLEQDHFGRYVSEKLNRELWNVAEEIL